MQDQRNFHKIPSTILNKIKSFSSDSFLVACVKAVRYSDLRRGEYKHLGIRIKDNTPKFNHDVMPPANVGRYSSLNISGDTIVRKDLPMVRKNISVTVPNYGDWGKGSHEIEWDREVYQRDVIPPMEVYLNIELIGEETKDEPVYLFKFSVADILNRKSKTFERDLKFAINLLQENVRKIDVYPAEASLADYLKTVYVDWEIIPVGERGVTLARLRSKLKINNPELDEKLQNRMDLFMRLKPVQWVSGMSGIRRYFGAQFSPSLVVFENLEYGNAIYIMFDQWEKLSKMTRIQLLTERPAGFVRIPHHKEWEERLEAVLSEHR